MRNLSSVAVVAGLLSLCSCVLSNAPPRNSRFKVDISKMEPVHFLRDSWIYRHPTKRVTDYSAFIIPAVVVYPNPADKIKDRAPYEALSRELTDQARRLFSEDYIVTDNISENTLRVEISIIDIKPVVQVNKGVTDSIIINSPEKGSKFDVDCFDAASEEEIFALSTLYKGEEYLAYRDSFLIRNIQSGFDEWLAFIKDKFDEAMEKRHLKQE